MADRAQWKPSIRMLLYGIQFQQDPAAVADRVLQAVLRVRPDIDFRAAIEQALASNERLSEMIPQDHPEPVIRAYLVEVARRLGSGIEPG